MSTRFNISGDVCSGSGGTQGQGPGWWDTDQTSDDKA